MHGSQLRPHGSTGSTPHPALIPEPCPEELLRLLFEPETQRSRSYWMTIVGCLMITLSCLVFFALAAAQR